ncbi:tetratricopeptide repeat protein [Neobacillus piezotolerans]|uniref:Tetratricopeptide repeat protein n=1 Tax=Neobacillus piezotolerans TaxID=2259171 RepID=A0A3D8GTX9_9BACI|nr:tetratricopeptide repeat protein [Neobacillus piezotolerans]RDU37681.1 tetratricopeptide repeat protein [Neobacillus piezotolerans]
MGKDSKAIKGKGKLLSFFPTGEYYFTKGLKAYHRRDFEKAKRYLQRAFQLEPGEPMIACQLALVWTEIGGYENSNRLLHLILDELDPEMTECHYFLANNYAHLGFFKDATHHSRLYLELEEDGEFADDAEDLLELLMMEGVDDDDELFEEDDLMSRQEEARNLLESGYFPKAIEMLTSIVEEYPEYWSAYNNLALAHFYLGETEQAHEVLYDVLERNPGNLHALCNLLVFANYRRDTKETERLIGILKKIKPIMTEHQFKLGATFALSGEYSLAYECLRKLHRRGYEGDGPFYYWYSYAAYYTGREKLAQSLWKKVIAISPDKEGGEPWNDASAPGGIETQSRAIVEKLCSDHTEERLFAIFLASVSRNSQELFQSSEFFGNEKLGDHERAYLTYLKEGKRSPAADAHDTAELLYQWYRPIGALEAGLFLMWFSVFEEAEKQGHSLKNTAGWAAATAHVWHKLRNDKVPMDQLVDQYGVSSGTIRKYAKLIMGCMR